VSVTSSSPSRVPEPPPADELDPLVEEWEPGRPIGRCHSSVYRATEFNATRSAGRFRPFTSARRTVPTLYGAEDFQAALSETVFQDVPVSGPGREVLISSLRPWLFSTIAARRVLRLVDLRGHGLRRLQLRRGDLINTPASDYPALARWGAAFYACPQAPDGIIWVSRQYDRSAALMLFGRRVSRRDLEVIDPPLPLAFGKGLEDVRDAAESAGILIVE
jgi:RES domain